MKRIFRIFELNWNVLQKELRTEDGSIVAGFKANVRDLDNRVLGVVTDRYKVVQNEEAFAFTDEVATTPVRVVCQNTLNLALDKAKRCWAAKHTGDIRGKMEEARDVYVYSLN